MVYIIMYLCLFINIYIKLFRYLHMSDSTRYFQLTPDILVEYNYHNLSDIHEMASKKEGYFADLSDEEGKIISNGYCSARNFFWTRNAERYVLPINKSESRFVQAAVKKASTDGYYYIWEWNTDFGEDYSFTSEGNEDYDDDILIDTFRLHFTGRNYLNDYDGYIINMCLYDKVKNKINLLYQYVKRTDDPNINPNPTLINQKLYTTYQDFSIPNITALINADKLTDELPAEKLLCQKLSPYYDIMENSPVMMTIYGVKAVLTNSGTEYYVTEKINSIYVPLEDKSNQFEVVIEEASDGDYFKIYPEIDDGKTSFSDYIYDLSDGRPERYIIFHELNLIEHYTDALNNVHHSITHREQYIINAARQVINHDETIMEINEDELDNIMYYRPIITNNTTATFTIEVKTHILNTLDNTTTVKKGSLDCGLESVKKYGKKMSRIYLGEVPAQINVYNKKPDIDIDGVKITNASSNVKIDNHQHSIIGFIECTNVGVSIEQVPQENVID